MASADNLYKARPSTAFRFYFPVYKSDGTLITASWTSVVITTSKDGAATATNVGTVSQITGLGMGYVDFTSGEIGTNKNISGTITVTNAGAAATPFSITIVADSEDAVNVVDWSGSAVASPATAGYPVVTHKVGTGTGELDLVSGRVKQVASLSGTASAGATQSITLAGGVATDNFYKYSLVTITGGTGAGQTRMIIDYVGSSKLATVNKPWTTNPDNTSTFDVLRDSDLHVLHSGIAQAGAGSTITLQSIASSDNTAYVGALIFITGGTGLSQIRVISGYVGSTKVATISQAWGTNPDNTSIYEILAVGRSQTDNAVVVGTNNDKTGYGLAADQAVNVTKVAGTSQTARDLGAQLDVAVSSRMATFTLPANFSSFSIDSSGRVIVITNSDKTGYALTAGEHTNVAADTQTGLTNQGYTTTRAGYQDNLNVGGHVASSAEVLAIQNNTNVVRVVPSVFERPDSGSTAFRIELLIYDDVGNMEAPDSAPTIDVVNQAGTSRNSNLDSTNMTLVSPGRYRSTYTIDTVHALEQLIFSFAVTEGSATRTYANPSFVVDTTAVDFTATDRTKLDALYGKLPSKSYLAGTGNSSGAIEADAFTGNLTANIVADKTGYGLADGAITAAKIAADAIGSTQLAASAVTEIQSGLGTSANQTTILSDLTSIQDDTDDIQSRLPSALVAGKMDVHVNDIAAAAITASSIATDAINSGGLAATAVSEIQSGLATSSALSAVQTHGDSTWITNTFNHSTDSVIVGTNNDKTGYALTSGEKTTIAGGVWDQLSGSHILSGSFGLLFSQIIASIASLVGVRTIIASFLDRQGVISIDQDTDATITWNSDDYPNLSGGTVTFTAEPTTKNSTSANISKSVAVTFADGTWALSLQFSHGDSVSYDTGNKVYRYKVMAALSGGNIVVLERGYLSVDKAIA